MPDTVKLFCDITGETVADNKPVAGSSIFTVESGIHTHGLGKCSMTYEPYEPEMVGLRRQIKIGKHSGRKAIEKRMEELGIDSSKYAMAIVLEAVRERSIQLKRDLYDEDLKALL
jgi:homocitrate synthase NifV